MKREHCGDIERGICVDCGKPCLMRHEYMVRSEVWLECGMGAWDAGFLHRECLEARIGRKLTRDDLLFWVVSETKETVKMNAHPDYLDSPEFRLHGGIDFELK